ncbi:hypothetical protein Saro_3228 [Novosphingobium aromaticivorans DSM 12444]|uniref:O-antigen ligase-related domain-containing protein n=1 Tax=Novosphingobium aromaticivorans (strain ATCC 700278 / DSM 12444 / CCUG 56034 / CIP 105152 / NBRC 16084 / F199) TaxID=279238 RepID=Q2G3B0_NOVAD|nr:O-antigen ligase family protein [Novosphingobium aromaticivorans]ABD27663.1 hypothetical protein Saro_3228 [Novosphingobium aromaticivorans DSM 12444]SCY31092.1 O-antigen ligase like membrane protein [Novosphingobium aromaticivorans]
MNASIASRAPYRPAARPRPVSAFRALLPAIILFYATIIPMEVRFDIADQTFYPPRVAGFLLLPWLITKLVGGGLRYRAVDGVMLAGVTWMLISFMVYYDPITGLLRSAPLAFDTVIPYLVARVCIKNLTDLRRFLIIAAPGIAIAGGSMALESFSHVPLVKPAAASIFGRLSSYENGVAVGSAKFIEETRLGLLRASGPFSHPILGGIYLSLFLPLYIYSGIRGLPRKLGIVGSVCGFFSLSSGAFLALLIGLGILVTDWVQKKVQFLNWRLIIGAGVLVASLLHLLSQRGLIPVLIRYTLDPATGRYRLYIWEYGTQSVAKHPLFGIGFSDWERLAWMGTSVDNHWLLLAMRHGLVVSVAFLFVLCYGIYHLAISASKTRGFDRNTYIGVAASLLTLLITGFTVAFFGQMVTMCYFFLGMAISLPFASSGRRAI